MVKKLSCVSCGSLKRFPHTYTTVSYLLHNLLKIGAITYFVVFTYRISCTLVFNDFFHEKFGFSVRIGTFSSWMLFIYW